MLHEDNPNLSAMMVRNLWYSSQEMIPWEAMQKDFEYEMAQKITRSLCEKGIISVEEMNRIFALNKEKFSPFYADILD